MYNSPIETICTQYRVELEQNILKAVRKVDVNVDKEELIKALNYDRNQYQKGYEDGIKEFAKRLDEWLKDDVTLFTQQRYIMEGAIEKTYLEMVGDDK